MSVQNSTDSADTETESESIQTDAADHVQEKTLGGRQESETTGAWSEITVQRTAYYDQVDEVAAYLVTFGELPDNYVNKSEAKKHGWEGGNVERYLFEGACIGGDRFGNYEGLLPEDESYRECDIDTIGKKSRGTKRLIYTEDITAIYYTKDHYDSFELIYEADG